MMINNILSMISKKFGFNPIQIMQMIQRASDPMAIMQKTLGGYPEFQRAVDMVKGRSDQELFQSAKNLLSQGGMNIDPIVGFMHRMGIDLPGVDYGKMQK